ncbi:hypothetical protein, partial [Duganella vulcania]|uniref:hypothetical protein n=1 Tax=Duganella vulcania TaxID=2692166 RepID=UPI001C2D6611
MNGPREGLMADRPSAAASDAPTSRAREGLRTGDEPAGAAYATTNGTGAGSIGATTAREPGALT